MTDHDTNPFEIIPIEHSGAGRIALSRLPGRTGQLGQDVEAIARWGARLVVSMTDTGEMLRYGAEILAPELTSQGIAHAHFPIRDFGTPEERNEGWLLLSRLIHQRLQVGEAVLLHCMGGKGRSGMVAMRLLIESGTPPDEALEAVRRARPGAVETEAQKAWAMEGLNSQRREKQP